MKEMLRTAREAKQMTLAELARQTGIDKALLSKFESGDRTPTRAQVLTLTNLLDIDGRELHIRWLSEKILNVCKGDELAKDALERVLQQASGDSGKDMTTDKLLEELEVLKNMILKKK